MVIDLDATEALRKEVIAEQQSLGPQTREQLAAQHGEVYDTAELQAAFSVECFLAPFVIVKRKADGMRGSLEFQHAPRLYWGFTPV